MPYIAQEDRERLWEGGYLQSKGDINYRACQAVIDYLEWLRKTNKKIGYTQISEAIDALRDAADELADRLLKPYERGARQRNGDIIPEWLLAHCEGRVPNVGAEKPFVSNPLLDPTHEPYWADRPDYRYGRLGETYTPDISWPKKGELK